MYAGRGRINNKDKQAAGGNWGHPRKYLKRHTKIDDPLIPDKGVPARSKKKKKIKKEYKFPYAHCPFCETKLPIKQKGGTYDTNFWYAVFDEYIKECPNCKATEVKECPACKHRTWRNIEGIYKHQSLGCGFEGKKLERKGLE